MVSAIVGFPPVTRSGDPASNLRRHMLLKVLPASLDCRTAKDYGNREKCRASSQTKPARFSLFPITNAGSRSRLRGLLKQIWRWGDLLQVQPMGQIHFQPHLPDCYEEMPHMFDSGWSMV
jgi:hypothetical protein